ncbi:hypothetical protein JCGZ_24923 [Jatropha curcas]|uniref:Protein kinase domain-containing protein n=1 Tax=Jatropha curcas TaxID=180498 RepID=A0A067L9Y0_JATCU|nr:hypothetical protein JCGZ_24923 [Jatropha curcas]
MISWNSSLHFCQWSGVICGRRHQRVTELNLKSLNLSGSISPRVGNLRFLRILRLENNSFSHEIPPQIEYLQRLQMLSVSNNSLSGQIPSTISNCSGLKFLYLDHNILSGQVPTGIGFLRKLVEIDVWENNLTGTIPLSLGNLSSIQLFYASRNHFLGVIPDTFGKLMNLMYLTVYDYQFSGNIRPPFFNPFMIISFEEIVISHNQIIGEIPDAINDFVELELFEASGNLTSLIAIEFSSNKFQGTIPSTIGNLTNLLELRLSNNNLSGHIPPQIFRLSPFSIGIDLSQNHLSGSLPKEELTIEFIYQSLLKATNGFSLDNLIGTGSFGSVYKGSLDREVIVIAVKVLNLERQGALKSFVAECEALRNIRHENLVKELTACSGVDYKGNDFKDLVSEFMVNGSLNNWLHPTSLEINEGSRTSNLLQRLNIAIDVAHALRYSIQEHRLFFVI